MQLGKQAITLTTNKLKHRAKAPLIAMALLLLGTATVYSTHAAETASLGVEAKKMAEYSQWVADMKNQARGPFKRLRWFCNDGSVHPPKAYACSKRGGGRQHGQWSDRTEQLRKDGFLVGNVLAATNAREIANDYSPLSQLTAILLEQFLIDIDDGWILRQARFYRGAFQIEAEQRAAVKIIKALSSSEQTQPIGNRFMLVLEAVKRLPSINNNQQLLTNIRTSATSIQKDNPNFVELRNKIHGRLDAGDAERVRDFVKNNKASARQKDMLALADNIDRLFAPNQTAALLKSVKSLKQQALTGLVDKWQANTDRLARYTLLGDMLPLLRELIEQDESKRPQRFALLAQLEQLAFISGREIIEKDLASTDRKQLLDILVSTQNILYGVGLLTNIERKQANQTIEQILTTKQTNDTTTQSKPFILKDYQQLLQKLARVPVWSERRVQFFFQEQVKQFSAIDPLAHNFVPDRLRGSPLLIYTNVLKVLDNDAATISGVQHSYFGEQISSGFRVLNPGVAKGVLHTPETLAALTTKPDDVILVVPETLADLPAVTGLLTAFEGNQLSHVQLLARNLGVPNIVISRDLLKHLPKYQGQSIELLASEGGVVSIRQLEPSLQVALNSDLNTTANSNQITINIDETKLDLTQTNALSLQQLDAQCSGVTVGPKAAKVARLARQFPGKVSPGLALPFGGFRKLLDSNRHASGLNMFEWIKAQYQRLDELNGDQKSQFRTAFLKELRHWFLTTELSPEFIADLKQKMQKEFGDDGSYGVFVRSDTNVEDLAGFTGAGLNLTVAHVVGFDNILAAIRKVWASPFSERAFGWRQARMNKPEHVYTAILLHKSVASDKSGVLVTSDIFSGEDNQLSVVLNEGVAGGVDGLSAESLRIDRESATTEYIAGATAPYKRVLRDTGGSVLVPASGGATQLNAKNIQDLIEFSEQVGQWFSDKADAVADVEFGFHQDHFVLFQIRPLVDSPVGKRDQRLLDMDKSLEKNSQQIINLQALPLT